MLGQLQDVGNTTTLARYLRLLSEAGLLAGLRGGRAALSDAGLKSEIERVEHRTDDRGIRLLISGGASGPDILGKIGERSWRTSVEYCRFRHSRSLLETKSLEIDFVLQRGRRVGGIEVKECDDAGSLRGFQNSSDSSTRTFHCLSGPKECPSTSFSSPRGLLAMSNVSTSYRESALNSSPPTAPGRNKTPGRLSGGTGICPAWGSRHGETTAFRMECEALGENAHFVSARNFLGFDLASRRPEWEDKILFIDGPRRNQGRTDEQDTPFEELRRRLDSLGRPRFRLSCRAADWLGSNDLKHLSDVSPASGVTVLTLEPLGESDIAEILSSHSNVNDAKAFVAGAGNGEWKSYSPTLRACL